jgi:aryl-alcohol dehydrogenase-like predicted oxidoreductase
VTLEWDQLGDIAEAVTRSIYGSLSRLGVEKLDIVHLHNRPGRGRAVRPNIGSGAQLSVEDVLGRAGVVETLYRLRDRGLVGAIGCCAYGGERDAVLDLIESDRFDSVLVHYSLLNRSAWSNSTSVPTVPQDYGGVGEVAARRGMAVVALRVLEAGLLTGGPPADQRARSEELSRFDFLLESGEATMVTPALRFVLSNAAISTALVGISTLEHIEEAVAAAGLGPLPSATIRRIVGDHSANPDDENSKRVRGVPSVV